MATKTISITEDAYNILKALKKESESFSEVINKMNTKRTLLSYSTILEDSEGKEALKSINKSRKNDSKRVLYK